MQYVVTCPVTNRCAIIDPVLDFDEKSGATSTRSADAILAYVDWAGLTVEWILDTHPHADNFSAAHYLKVGTGAPTAIGERVTDVQALWKDIYNWPTLPADGSQWDRLLADGERFRIGEMEARVLFSPGHTLASITYVVGDAAFIHDTMFRRNIPNGTTHDAPVLTVEEAWDVAAYMVSIDRPRNPGVENDFPVRAEKARRHRVRPYIDGFPQKQHKYGSFQAIRDQLQALKNVAGENAVPPAR